MWIEAVAPSAGSGPDEAKRVFGQRTKTKGGGWGLYHVDHDKITIRYTSALRDKASLTRDPPSQYVRFVERGAVSTSDAFVVAINAGAIDDADLPPDLPGIIPALFPVGEPVYLLPIGGGEPRVEVPLRPSIRKTSGASVATTAFTSDEFVNVSAVIFTPYGIWNADGVSGRDFVTVHNPLARVPLPRGAFRFGREYWVEVEADGMGRLREHHHG